MKKHNFSSGPAILPAEVMEQAAAAVKDLNGIGLSVLEISHRSSEFVAILEETETLVRELLKINNEYAVLFLTGGASTQFFMSAMNLLGTNETAAFIDTGSWSVKAIKEANLFGKVDVIASSKDQNYTYIPKDYTIPEGAKYLHFTSNNTIFGTQFHELPDTTLPLVCDMSSDIFSRPFDVNRFSLIYAGAQKNLGPAGTTLVIVRKELLGTIERSIPTMLNYETHIKKNSAFNTPPVFPIYVCLLTLRWLKEKGGVEAMVKHNKEKAQLLYQAIDESPYFVGNTKVEDRSLMNVTFVMAEGYEDRAADFLSACEQAHCSGVKGHRSVGGFRASIYNAMPKSSVETLISVIRSFQ